MTERAPCGHSWRGSVDFKDIVLYAELLLTADALGHGDALTREVITGNYKRWLSMKFIQDAGAWAPVPVTSTISDIRDDKLPTLGHQLQSDKQNVAKKLPQRFSYETITSAVTADNPDTSTDTLMIEPPDDHLQEHVAAVRQLSSVRD